MITMLWPLSETGIRLVTMNTSRTRELWRHFNRGFVNAVRQEIYLVWCGLQRESKYTPLVDLPGTSACCAPCPAEEAEEGSES